MSTRIIVRGGEPGWQTSRIPGVAYRMLKEAPEKNAGTFLVKMEPGTAYPPHLHPGGEEVYVVSGAMRVGPDRLVAGDYLFTPPGGSHDADTVEGCTFLVVLPDPVEFLPRKGSIGS